MEPRMTNINYSLLVGVKKRGSITRLEELAEDTGFDYQCNTFHACIAELVRAGYLRETGEGVALTEAVMRK